MLKRIRKLFVRRTKTASDGAKSTSESSAETAGAVVLRPPAKAYGAPAVHHGPLVVHRPIPPQDLDDEAVKIVRRLTRFDHSAYLVGGCVRDLLLGVTPKDFDLATSATPRQVKRLFSNCRIIGRRFRLAHIYFQTGKIIEVATFRAGNDPDAADVEREEAPPNDDLMIRDDNVFGTPEEDALRRDFTINALFYDVNQDNVIDHTNGLEDLRRRLVRTIGDPAIRFREDPIRILRAVKFAARLGFQIEPGTLAALRDLRGEIPKAASARILEEINRFCRGGAARASFELLRETGVLAVILPEISADLATDERAWRIAMTLFEHMDAAHKQGREASTGQILVCLLFPLFATRMGWSADGRVTPTARINIRDAVDEYLRPMALRLQVSRRDQEECRQILLILQRMVPVGSLRRGAREAIARRPAFKPSLAILAAAAAAFGGDPVEAAKFWRDTPVVPETRARVPAGSQAQGAARDGSEMRRRRRGGRGRNRSERPTTERSQPTETKPVLGTPATTTDSALPPPWDDRYFFAALPTAKSEAGLAAAGDRYGAALTGAAEASTDAGDGAANDPIADPADPEAKKKTRRRRRGPRRPREGAKAAVPEGSGTPSHDDGSAA